MFKIKEIIEITGAELLVSTDISGKFSISTDTRTIAGNDIFLPLLGQNFDGHNFINTALEKGVRGFFIDKNHKNINTANAQFILLVDDTLEAYLKLANSRRHKIYPQVIAITGSSGKTTTKEMVYSVLSQQFRTYKSQLNHNNEVGLCQTLLNMPEDTEYLVVEMGMRASGEIELLSKYAEPDTAIITNIGTAHIGRLGSIENIAKAKCEITKYLKDTLIAHDDELIRNNMNWNGKAIFYNLDRAKITKINSEGSQFVYKDDAYELNVAGEYNIVNSLAAIEAGLLAGISPSKISQGLSEYRPIINRWQVNELPNNIKLINDSYNANPDSVKAAINAILSSYPQNKAVLVLGDMAELGEHEEDLHKQIGNFLNDKPIYELVTVGDKASLIAKAVKNEKIKQKTFTKNDEAVKYLLENLEENSVILLKASRCMAFENIAEGLIKVGV